MNIAKFHLLIRKKQPTLHGETLESRNLLHADLVVSEAMYFPPQPTADETAQIAGLNADAFEFVELHHPGSSPIDLRRVQLRGDVTFDLPSEQLEPGEYGVIVANETAFRLRYGDSIRVLGEWEGSLSDEAFRLEIVDALDGHIFLEIQGGHGELWPIRAQGIGASLELIDPANPQRHLTKPNTWKASSQFAGTPGDSSSDVLDIVINEVVANDFTGNAIELYNRGNQPAEIGGWYLSDSALRPNKFKIPPETTLAPGEFLAFEESDFNPIPETPAQSHFAIDAIQGGQVWLTSTDEEGKIVSFVDEVQYGATLNDNSYGRFPDGAESLMLLDSQSIGDKNGIPRVGPVIITEIHGSPAQPSFAALTLAPSIRSRDLPFVEIHNTSNATVDLSEWNLSGDVTFEFTGSTLLEPAETVIVTSFDPNDSDREDFVVAFQLQFGINEPIRMLGPFQGSLGEQFGVVRLSESVVLDDANTTIQLPVDVIIYDDESPWPASETGVSLHRQFADAYGNRDTNWQARTPSPGSADTLTTMASRLLVSEIHFAPSSPSEEELDLLGAGTTSSAFEFIEFFNPDDQLPVSLSSLALRGDSQFAFQDQQLAPGEYAVVVANEEAFRLRHGNQVRVLGEFSGQLNDDEAFVLVDNGNAILMNFSVGHGSRWPNRVRGNGASLELANLEAPPNSLGRSLYWQASSLRHGTPGKAISQPSPIRINELQANSPDAPDAIELLNIGSQTVDIGGWYLSDAADQFKKFQIPASTVLGAGELVVFDESDFNSPDDPIAQTFELDGSGGGQLWLVELDDSENLVRFVDNVHFGSEPLVGTWARFANDGGELLLTTNPTLGQANSEPRLGSLIISEFNFDPGSPSAEARRVFAQVRPNDLEFVELYNRTQQPVDLANWQLAGDFPFEFEASLIINPGESIVVVSFDAIAAGELSRTLAFRAHYGIGANVRVIGGLNASLKNDSGDLFLLERFDLDLDEPGLEGRFLVDRIRYENISPWPLNANGTGLTLNRNYRDVIASDPSSWTAASPSPGTSTLTNAPLALLPDLVLWTDPIFGFNHLEYFDTHATTGRKLMRFATAMSNQGTGPLSLVGGDVVGGQQQVVQVIQYSDGTTQESAAGEFVLHPTHRHIHFADYAQYNLREITEENQVGDIVASGDKISFCLIDYAPFDTDMAGSPQMPAYLECEKAEQGISVGWADIYTADLDDQWIDIDDLEDGEYWFETIIDPENRLQESDETNNTYLQRVVIGVPEFEPDRFDQTNPTGDPMLGTGDKSLEGLSIHIPGDVDSFRWIAPNDGEVNVSLQFDRELGDVDLYAWGAKNGKRVNYLSAESDDAGEQGSFNVTKGETYFFVVQDLSGYTNPSYQIDIDGPDIDPDSFEPNDVFLEPAELSVGNQTVPDLSIHRAGERDYFLWQSDKDGVLHASLDFKNTEGKLSLFVFDFESNQVFEIAPDSTSGIVQVDVIAGIDYLISVVADSDDFVSNYKLNLVVLDIFADQFEPNDNRVAPVDIPSGDNDFSDLTIHVPFNRDFYRWQPKAAGVANFEILFDHDAGNLDAIFWVNGENIALFNSVNDNETFSFEVRPRDEYMIEVFGAGNATNPSYRLIIESPEPPQVADLRVSGPNRTAKSLAFDDLLPWVDVDRIEVAFTKDVVVNANMLQLIGADGNTPSVLEFNYDANTFTATWVFSAPIADDAWQLVLRDLVVDAHFNKLDGEPNDIADIPSGDGIPGGDFTRSFQIRRGDFDASGFLNINDVNALLVGMREDDIEFDLTGDQKTNQADLTVMIEDLFMSDFGDANLDGVFNSSDFTLIFQAGEYQDAVEDNSTWSEGDWNGDGDFDSSDLIVAFQAGGYIFAASPLTPIEPNRITDRGTDAAQPNRASSHLPDRAPQIAAAIENLDHDKPKLTRSSGIFLP